MKKLISKMMSCVMVITAGISLGSIPVQASVSDQSFNVLSLNVAGLPAIISSSNPSKNTKLMSELLNNYDVVSVQEDFAYHSDLISKAEHSYLTAHSGNVPFGDGMNFLSNFSLDNTIRVKWEDSYGFVDNGADQMTPKGILYSSMEVAPGYTIDIYNLHADAGSDEGSYAARRSNLIQLGKMIEERSAGKAVIVMGDTNSRYTRAQDNFESAVLDRCELVDAWIETKCEGIRPADGESLMNTEDRNSNAYEVVDKIWYRSGKDVTLSLQSYDLLENEFVDEAGEQLSDHYPITAIFNFAINEEWLFSGLYGGTGGNGFSMIDVLEAAPMTKLSVKGGTRLDGIGAELADGTTWYAGGTGGTVQEMLLADEEYIVSVELSKGKKSLFGTERITYIKVTTNLGNNLEAGTRGETSLIEAPSGYCIAGFYGMAGDEIDSLGVIFNLY